MLGGEGGGGFFVYFKGAGVIPQGNTLGFITSGNILTYYMNFYLSRYRGS